MRRFAFFAPLAAAAAVASLAHAGPNTQSAPQPADVQVTVEIGGDLIKEAPKLGDRDVQYQRDELAKAVSRALNRAGNYPGARVNLVLTDLKPNRPTVQQTVDMPGLSMIHSISIGGATIEGEIVTADGQRLPVHYSRYSTSLAEVYGYTTWADADRAYADFAGNLARGRLIER